MPAIIVSPDMVQIHANCVALRGHGVLLRGPSGAGKSDLSLRLIRRGGWLVADDRTVLHAEDGELVARVPATIAGLLEVRGIGVVEVRHRKQATVRAIIDLVPPEEVDRLPDPHHDVVCGITVPVWRLWAFEIAATEKIEVALAIATGEMRTRI
ncbi:MAG: HPr kinase/phosphatase C-terminal domain-containing protein [Pseudomonadota bacterium]